MNVLVHPYALNASLETIYKIVTKNAKQRVLLDIIKMEIYLNHIGLVLTHFLIVMFAQIHLHVLYVNPPTTLMITNVLQTAPVVNIK